LKEYPKTNSGTWTIRNYTRYNTDDLVNLCNCVEQHIPVPLNKYPRSYRNAIEDRTFLTFDIFNPAPPKNAYARNKAEEYVKDRDYYKDEIRIICPSKLDLSDIEALSYTQDSRGTPVPKEMVARLLFSICFMYAGCTNTSRHLQATDWLPYVILDVVSKSNPDLSVHYTDKVAERKPILCGGDERLKKFSAKATQDSLMAIVLAKRETDILKKCLDKLNAHGKKRGISHYVDPQRFEDIAEAISRLNSDLLYVERMLG